VAGNTFRLLALPDVHTPYHHAKAWACALDVARRWRPDGCVQLGDFSSFDSVSSHDHDPKKTLPLADEVAGSNLALDELDAALKEGGCARGNRWMLEGNHEVRVDRYVQKLAPELRFAVDWRDMLNLDRRGWKVVPYKETLEFGELRLSHDFGRAGIAAARQSLIDVGTNVLFGHTHRLQVVYQGTQAGKRHVGCTAGWLGDSEAIDYRHRDLVRRDWQLGLVTVEFLASGEFWLQAVPIVRGRCVIDGVIYSA
jgi:predicted phosphodiesterase